MLEQASPEMIRLARCLYNQITRARRLRAQHYQDAVESLKGHGVPERHEIYYRLYVCWHGKVETLEQVAYEMGLQAVLQDNWREPPEWWECKLVLDTTPQT